MDQHLHANRAIWDAWSASDEADSDHARDEARVRAGGSSLRGIELTELGGEVAGKSLLHLLCNRGSDTLSWARLGATVTGVDFSAPTIARARALATEINLPARFIQSDLFALPDTLQETFDIVYASYGVLCWLPDLTRWASIVARYVRPGGLCYLVEMHPASGLLAADAASPVGLRLRPDAAYFHAPAPHIERVTLPTPAANPGKNGNSASPSLHRGGERAGERGHPSGKNGNVDRLPHAEHSGKNGNTSSSLSPAEGAGEGERSGKNGNTHPLPASGRGQGERSLATWSYSLGEVITALAEAGLRLEYLREHPATFYRQFPTLVEGSDRLWHWPDPAITLPLLFSLRARG